MTDDLTTLLRDAGREPTIDLDVDAVHGRGRRRAVGRRVAVSAGALALLGVLGAGVATLLDAPDAPLIDQAPNEDTAPAPAEDGSDHEQGRAGATAAMADLGLTVVDVVRSEDGAGGLQARVVTEDGVVEEFGTAAGALPPLSSPVVVTEDRRVWLTDADPNLLVGGPDDPVGRSLLQAQDGVGWTLLGTSEDGLPLVAPAVGPGGQFTGEEPRNVFVLRDVDFDAAGTPGTIMGISGIDAGPVLEDHTPVAAAAVPELLALLTTAGEQSTVWLFRAGEPTPVTLAETDGVESRFIDVAFLEDEVWIAAEVEGATELWIAPIDGSPVRRVAAPVGRGDHANEFVVDLQALQGDAGWVVTMSTATLENENGPAWVVDVDAVRAAEVGRDPADTMPTRAFEVLDAAGHVHLLPPPAPDEGESAACATDEDLRPNVAPVEPGALVFLCWDAMDDGPEFVAYPFVAVSRWNPGDGTIDGDALLERLGVWAAGPSDLEAGRGLSGGVDRDVVTFQSVTTGGPDGLVEIGLAAGPQAGVLGTTTGGATFVQAVVAMVLQYDGFDRVQFTLDGSCEAWAGLLEGEGCPVYDSTHTPWVQPGAGTADAEGEDLADGRHAVYLEAIDLDARTLTVDVIQWLTGDEARDAYLAETGDPDGPPNDYYVVNENPRLRTLQVADPVDVQLVRLLEDGDADLDPGTWDELPTYFEAYRSGDVDSPGLSFNPFWLTVEDGVITAIEEQYLP